MEPPVFQSVPVVLCTLNSINFSVVHYRTKAGVIAAQTLVAWLQIWLPWVFLAATGDMRKVLPFFHDGESSLCTNDVVWVHLHLPPKFLTFLLMCFLTHKAVRPPQQQIKQDLETNRSLNTRDSGKRLCRSSHSSEKGRTCSQMVIWKLNSYNCICNCSTWMPKLPGQRKSLGYSLFNIFGEDEEVTLCLNES